jgi:hypothetical protein
MGPHLAALCGLSAVALAPDAVVFGQAGELSGNLLAVRLVISADFPDQVAGVPASRVSICRGVPSRAQVPFLARGWMSSLAMTLDQQR